ncbi:ABC-three component system protein [Nevskia sp.]|uniref:ABC-three component system protein n=1 Tax=Nevskia sp. TaxID=1929292 RepID=UPI003F71A7ED
MTEPRRALNQAEELRLLCQVNSRCPEGGEPLFYTKGKRTYKGYELAHIYPLNPTKAEEELLRHEERLATDPNDLDNLIPLCVGCHGKFDKPRTVEDYRRLVQTKREAVAAEERNRLQFEYALRDEISAVVRSLDSTTASMPLADPTLIAKTLDDKLDQSVPSTLRRKIHFNVSDYFVFVRQQFQTLEGEQPGVAELISSQVRAFYLELRMQGLTKPQIFAGVVDWIVGVTKPSSIEPAEIVASFFVQNCEVFE